MSRLKRYFRLESGIIKETLIYSAGSFGSKILSFLLVPFYTYFLTPQELGEYDLLITTISLIVPFVSWQLSDGVYRWLVADFDSSNRRKVISNCLTVLIFSNVLFAVIFLIVNLFVEINYSFLLGVLVFLSSLLPFFLSVLRGLGQTKLYAKSGLFTTFLTVISTFSFVYFFEMGVSGIMLATILSYLVSILVIMRQVKIWSLYSQSLFDQRQVKDILKYSVPLIPNLISWWVISSASKYVILIHLGQDANGIYAVASRFPSLLLMVNSVLLLPLQDEILKNNSEKRFSKLFLKFTLFELGLIALLVMMSPLLTRILLERSYYEVWRYMPYLYMGVGFNALAAFLGIYFQEKKDSVTITISSVIGALISILLSFGLVKTMGLMGISLSFFLGFFTMFGIRFLKIYKKPNRYFLIILVITSVMMLFFSLIIY